MRGGLGENKGEERAETVRWYRTLYCLIRHILKPLSSPPSKSIHLIEVKWKQVKGAGFQFGAKAKIACVRAETRYKIRL